MTKKGASFFNVVKSGKVVDCIKAADIVIAMQAAMDRWERFLGKEGTLSVVPTPAAKARLVVSATRSEVSQYANWPYGEPVSAHDYWTRPAFAAQEK